MDPSQLVRSDNLLPLAEARFPRRSDSLFDPLVRERLQIHSGTGISQDYFNQFYSIILLVDNEQALCPLGDLFQRVRFKINQLRDYESHLREKFVELKLAEGTSPSSLDLIVALSPARVRFLNEVVQLIKSLHFTGSESRGEEETERKLTLLRVGVYLIGEAIFGENFGKKQAAHLQIHPLAVDESPWSRALDELRRAA